MVKQEKEWTGADVREKKSFYRKNNRKKKRGEGQSFLKKTSGGYRENTKKGKIGGERKRNQ